MAEMIDTVEKRTTSGYYLARYFAMFHPGYRFGAIGPSGHGLSVRHVVSLKLQFMPEKRCGIGAQRGVQLCPVNTARVGAQCSQKKFAAQ